METSVYGKCTLSFVSVNNSFSSSHADIAADNYEMAGCLPFDIAMTDLLISVISIPLWIYTYMRTRDCFVYYYRQGHIFRILATNHEFAPK